MERGDDDLPHTHLTQALQRFPRAPHQAGRTDITVIPFHKAVCQLVKGRLLKIEELAVIVNHRNINHFTVFLPAGQGLPMASQKIVHTGYRHIHIVEQRAVPIPQYRINWQCVSSRLIKFYTVKNRQGCPYASSSRHRS